MSNGTADDVRWIEVSPERLATWLESFAQRHGNVAVVPWGADLGMVERALRDLAEGNYFNV